MKKKRRQRIAILGGGLASLTAAYELAIQDRYDITVYQMGWRPGVLGPRPPTIKNHDRIEEHGLHVWFGYYENAFNLMRKCYRELDRSPHQPLPDVYGAFTGHDSFVFEEYIKGEWRPWKITFPSDDNFPGVPSNPLDPDSVSAFPTPWDFIVRLIRFARDHFVATLLYQLIPSTSGPVTNWPTVALRFAGAALRAVRAQVEFFLNFNEVALIERAFRKASTLKPDSKTHYPRHHEIILKRLQKFRGLVLKKIEAQLEEDDQLRRNWIMLDLSITCVIGMIQDEVLTRGFDDLNEFDFREWLISHGASQVSIDSALIQALYDVLFAYKKGDTRDPNLGAGLALLGGLRTGIAYKGHVLYTMNAGMGETVFAPLYLVLKERGVQFKFFHRVKRLQLTADRKKISRVHLARQVTIEGEEYDPLIDVKGLPCWPSTPRYEQIREGKILKRSRVDLESHWAKWPDADPDVILESGTHFDIVLLGISIGALPFICKDLIRANDGWKKMVKRVETVQTQQIQLWFRPTSSQLGFPSRNGIVASFEEPQSTWADFTHLIERENFDIDVDSIFYGCGVIKHAKRDMPPPKQHGFPARQLARVKTGTKKLLTGDGKILWPKAYAPRFKFQSLVDSKNRKGVRRLDGQYFHVNVDPSERYVQAIAGSDQFRLRANGSGFANLYLTGTWINHGYNLSCVEAAVMSGMAASQAISGKPKHIVGGRPPARPKKT